MHKTIKSIKVMRIKYYLLLLIIICFSCSKDKVILLPEIEHTKITEVNDVSPAYLFYNVKKEDSIELNRKNLISTTNWLVNVDKRLTLVQAIPKIKFLQDKKRNAQMHKNEDAKNYYTCNDTSIKNLGFIEFTDIIYNLNENDEIDYPINIEKTYTFIRVINNEKILLQSTDNGDKLINHNELFKVINNFSETSTTKRNIVLAFKKQLSFQDYISVKSELSKLKSDNITIDNNEFIY